MQVRVLLPEPFMKYASTDIETTGLNPRAGHQILEIGIIIEDTVLKPRREDCPQFHCFIQHPVIIGEPYALAMNAEILYRIDALAKQPPKDRTELLLAPGEVVDSIWAFLLNNGFAYVNKVVLAGKNVASFDRQFIRELPKAETLPLSHRNIDPAMLYMDLQPTRPRPAPRSA